MRRPTERRAEAAERGDVWKALEAQTDFNWALLELIGRLVESAKLTEKAEVVETYANLIEAQKRFFKARDFLLTGEEPEP